MIGRSMLKTVLLGSLLGVAMSQGLPAQAGSPPDKTESDIEDVAKKAGDIATQPVRDVGVVKHEIPPVLEKAVADPYGPAGAGNCTQISASLKELNATLGPDLTGASEKKEDKTGKLAEAGGKTLVNTLLPFRGLVREVSGAAPAERRMAAAIGAGFARRGYLRGLHQARRCSTPTG